MAAETAHCRRGRALGEVTAWQRRASLKRERETTDLCQLSSLSRVFLSLSPSRFSTTLHCSSSVQPLFAIFLFPYFVTLFLFLLIKVSINWPVPCRPLPRLFTLISLCQCGEKVDRSPSMAYSSSSSSSFSSSAVVAAAAARPKKVERPPLAVRFVAFIPECQLKRVKNSASRGDPMGVSGRRPHFVWRPISLEEKRSPALNAFRRAFRNLIADRWCFEYVALYIHDNRGIAAVADDDHFNSYLLFFRFNVRNDPILEPDQMEVKGFSALKTLSAVRQAALDERLLAMISLFGVPSMSPESSVQVRAVPPVDWQRKPKTANYCQYHQRHHHHRRCLYSVPLMLLPKICRAAKKREVSMVSSADSSHRRHKWFPSFLKSVDALPQCAIM